MSVGTELITKLMNIIRVIQLPTTSTYYLISFNILE